MAKTELFARKQSGGMFSIVNETMTTGNILFVNSVTGVDSAGGGQNPDAPLATLDYAIGLCTANQGDRIYLMPNHAETITVAGGITADIAGITIIGMGTYNQRPRFLMDGVTTVSFVVSADDVTVQNCVFASGHADVVTCFDVTKKGFTLLDCEFVDNVVDENFKSCVKFSGTANTSDGGKILNNRFVTPDAATLGFILCVDDIRDLVVRDNFVVSEGTGLATLITCTSGKDLQYVDVRANFLSSKATAGNLFISNDTASPNNSGIVAHNRCGHADVTGAHVLGVVGGCRMFDNLSVSTDALSGFVVPAIDVDL
jgi:hypothetical protein